MLKEDEKILILEKIKRFFSNNRFNYILFFCTYAKNRGFYFVHFFSKKKLKLIDNYFKKNNINIKAETLLSYSLTSIK